MSSTAVDKLSKTELQQLAISYAAFVLGDSGAKVNATSLQAVLDAAGVQVDKAWVTQFGKTLESRSIDDFCHASSGGSSEAAAPAAKAGKDAKEDKKNEPKKDDKKEAKKDAPPPPPAEEEGVDMGGLFDF
jgi:ribosomal protein L12E/L44/L45/RPP1/RPP2